MKSLEEQIKELQFRFDLLQFAKILLNEPEGHFFYKASQKIKKDVKNQLVGDLKKFLTKYIENLEQNSIDSENKNILIQVPENTHIDAQLQKTFFTPATNIDQNPQSVSQKENFKPFRTILIDTSYLTNCYEIINPDSQYEIIVLELLKDDQYRVCLSNDRRKEFLVPADVIED